MEVPFTNANRRTEGVVLALTEVSPFEKLKPVLRVLDAEPLLTGDQIKLALWMHERFFCTVYEAVKAMLPAGLWYKGGKRRVNEKFQTMAALAVPTEEAAEAAEKRGRRAPQQAEVLRTLCAIGRASLQDLKEFTGASSQTVKTLCSAGYIELQEVPVYRRPELATGVERAALPELSPRSGQGLPRHPQTLRG